MKPLAADHAEGLVGHNPQILGNARFQKFGVTFILVAVVFRQRVPLDPAAPIGVLPTFVDG